MHFSKLPQEGAMSRQVHANENSLCLVSYFYIARSASIAVIIRQIRASNNASTKTPCVAETGTDRQTCSVTASAGSSPGLTFGAFSSSDVRLEVMRDTVRLNPGSKAFVALLKLRPNP